MMSTDPSHAAPVTVYTASNSREAHLLVSLLTDEQIEARLASEAFDGTVGDYPPFQAAGTPVLVHAADADRAKPIVAAFQAQLESHQPAAVEPFCYSCGESLAARVSPCPHCGTELDWSPDADDSTA